MNRILLPALLQSMKPIVHLTRALAAVSLVLAAPMTHAAADVPPEAPKIRQVPYLSAEDELKSFQLQPGYHLEPVVTDPIIREPVVAAFDGNGRMFVAELRTYMQDIDGTDENAPRGRVSLHWSSKGDGNFDRHTVFADKLVLPRMILPLADGLLINETDTEDLYLYRDTDGDGVADTKEIFYKGGRRGGNLEHQQSGLIWSQDNWIYQAVNAYRLRLVGTNVVREDTHPNGGQWGLTQDNYGKPWFINAGGEVGPLNFQVPIAYLDFRLPSEVDPGFREVWPIVGLADVQGGEVRFRPDDKTLNHFTATCGDDIFRGDRLPADLRGDLLFGEPVGRLIRRAKVEVREGLTYLSNPYEKSEFIRSSDPNFRPVNMVTAPDGTLYIVDMYRGIIQEGNWTRPGSFLRPRIEENGLQNNFGRGRIWRLVHDDFKPGPQPHMLDESPAQLVEHLAHPNGWWRDTAQKLLVLKGDKSVVPALRKMARSHPDHLARIHALWTLEGLDSIDPTFIRESLKDSHPQVRLAAIRAGEHLFKQRDTALEPDILAMLKDRDAAVVMQAMMTSRMLGLHDSEQLVETTGSASSFAGVKTVAERLLAPPPGADGLTANDRRVLKKGQTIYKELCFSCHGDDGKGMPLAGGAPGTTLAPSLAGSKTVEGPREGVIKILLKGLTGPVAGRKYDAQMVSMESNDDAWIAAVSSYVRNSFGNHASLVGTNEVARFRAGLANRTEPWTVDELAASLPQFLTNRAAWKLSASHNNDKVKAAIDGDLGTRFDTGTSQRPGMWFQIELPTATRISGIVLDATGSARDYPRGYTVQVSSDGQNWGTPIANGKGHNAFLEIVFPPVSAKFIRINQTGSVDGLFWSIHELNLLTPPLMQTTSVRKPAKPAGSGFE
jgi:mono/diheme cytochrome c family protein/glucose/arabinose dehydrogenase